MYLKRLKDDDGRYSQVKVLRTGDAWRPSTRIIEQGSAQGWLTLGKGYVTLHTPEGDVRFRIVRGPGRRCVHCGMELGSEREAKAHVAAEHADAAAHPEHPAGYEHTRFYDCVREH